MSKTEIESKLELSADDFEVLRCSGRIADVDQQLNVYYDCRGQLSVRSATFRVRLRAGRRPVMTLKLPKSREGARRTSVEVEREVTGGERVRPPALRSLDLPNEFAQCLGELGIDRLDRVGWMRNTRYVVFFTGDEHPIELDCTSLPDGSTVYEAEIECDDLAVHERLVDTVYRLARSARPSKTSKFERFVMALRGSART